MIPFISPRRPRFIALALAAISASTHVLSAQQQSVPALPPYRPPVIALVQPASGGSVPADRPVVVFRFAPGEDGDPIDAASFAVSVDGVDRTAGFHVSHNDAWGTIGDAGRLEPRTRQLAARICSARGACGSVSAPVIVAASSVGPAAQPMTDRKKTLLDVLLTAAKKLLDPH